MKVLLVFEDWKKVGRSVYETPEGEGLTWGPFHHGTTFEADIHLNKESEEELKAAMDHGFIPVWATLKPSPSSPTAEAHGSKPCQ